MHDTSSMSTFEKYVVGTSVLSQEQMDACKVVQKALAGWGVRKTLEEVVLLKGMLDAEQMGRVLADIKEKWKISIPRPVLYSVADEKDKALQDKLVEQSPKTASQVLECRKIQESAKQLGIPLKVSEILIAKGYYTPPGQAPAAPKAPAAEADDLLPDGPPPAKEPVRPGPGRKPAPAAAARKAAPAGRPGARGGAARDREGAEPAPKKNPLVLWLSVGGAAAAVLVGVLVVALSGDTPPPEPPKPAAEKPKGKQVVLHAEGFDSVPVYTEAELLELHTGDDPRKHVPAATRVPVGTPVTLSHHLRTNRNLWYQVKTAKGTEGWVVHTHLKATFDLADERVPDYRQDWEEKLQAKKGGAVAKAPEPARTDTTPKPLEVPKPVEAPRPADPSPPPARDPEPAPVEAPKPAPAAAPMLVARWPFDGAPDDATGAGHHGTPTGGPAWVNGPQGKALAFDGADDFVRVPRTPALESPAVTVALWLKRNGTQATWANVVRKTYRNNTGPTWASWSLQLSPSDGGADKVSFNTGSGAANHHLHSTRPIPDDTWVHVAAVYDPAGPAPQKRLYVNGALDASASVTAPMLYDPTPTGDVYLGQSGAGTSKELFKGALDEVRIYNHALDADEVRQLAGDAAVAQAPPKTADPSPPAKPATPDKPKPPAAGDAKKQQREQKAQELWDQAVALEKEGKFAEAQEKLKELRTRYKSTSLYWDKMIEITDKINEIGQRLAVGSLLKTTLYRKPHMDSWYSFEFAPPDGWKGVPPQPNWFGEQDNDETFYRGRTYRIARYTAPYFDKLYMTVYKTFACESLEYLESKATGAIEEYGFKGLKEESKSADRGKMPYLRKTYSTPAGDRLVVYYFFQDRKGLALVGAWRAGGEDEMWVRVTITTSSGSSTRKTKDHPVAEEDFKVALKVFDQAAKTFWIYDAGTRQGKRVQLDMSALCADWKILKSSKGGYIIEYATRDDYAKRAAEEMEQILALYKAVIPSQKTIPPCRIKIFDREEDFQWYSYAFGAAAYWSPGQEEIVCYRFEGDKLKSQESNEEFTIAETMNPEEVTFKVLYHEGFHQYMYFYMGRDRGVYVPSWLNEGMGDYFFGGQWVKGGGKKFEIGLNDWRLKTIHNAVKKGEHVPLDKIIRYEQRQYYANPGLCYAEGWALNYFFQKSPVAQKKGYHAIPRQMLQELKTSANWEKATDKVFGGLDLKKMEEEWKEFVLSLPVPKDKDEEANR